MNIIWKGSPNYSGRADKKPEIIVIHWFGLGTLESANMRFQDSSKKVSAHYGISKSRIWQWVKEEHSAWHSGNDIINKRSIGIEHDATTTHNLAEEDYQVSGQLVYEIARRHNIPLDREHVIQHKQVKPTQCPGTIDVDRIITIAKQYMQTTLHVQLVFNNQRYSNEQQVRDDIKARMTKLSGGKVIIDFYPTRYTELSSIPAKVFMDTTGQQDMAVDKEWIIQNVWANHRAADVVIFIGRPGDWQNQHDGITTFGHYYSELPAVFPAIIQIVAAEVDRSWKYPELSALAHYVPHEISHALFQNAGSVDRTHEFDYQAVDGLMQCLPYLDYNIINNQLSTKRDYMTEFPYFIKQGDPTIYVCIGGMNLLPVACSWQDFISDYPGAKDVKLTPDAFLAYRIGPKTLMTSRK